MITFVASRGGSEGRREGKRPIPRDSTKRAAAAYFPLIKEEGKWGGDRHPGVGLGGGGKRRVRSCLVRRKIRPPVQKEKEAREKGGVRPR